MGIQGRGRAGQGPASVVQRGVEFLKEPEEPVIEERDDVRDCSFAAPNSLVWNEMGLYLIMKTLHLCFEIDLMPLPNCIGEGQRV